MTKLAKLIATMEGFYENGTKPQRFNNPGDLRHSPHSQHSADKNGIGQIDTVAHGWEDLERQLQLYADRGLTIQEMVFDYYAPPSENNSAEYLSYVCDGLGLQPTAQVTDALKI